jgi:PmbA protein
VILEPAAVGQLLLFLAFMGFGGKTLFEKRSFMSGKIGEKICGDNMTITEDPFNPQMLGVPFDYEGVPRKRVPLIEKGIAKGGVYNSYYARLAGVESTGHALPPNNSFGPYPKHMVMTAGTTPLAEMIKSTTKGIYITHFWYVNYLNPMKTMVTGTTRDGTFLIENGIVTKPIKNMRISQSILEAFSNVDMISIERKLYPQYSVVMLVPALKINNFSLETTEG